MTALVNSYNGDGPDELGQFGRFGGAYMPETLMPALHELTRTFDAASADQEATLLPMVTGSSIG